MVCSQGTFSEREIKMIKGKVVRLEILNSDDDSLGFYLEVGKESLNVHNLTDHFLGVKVDDIRDEFNLAYNDIESDDFLFSIVFGKKKVGLLYILREVEKRTAEIQVLLSENKYRNLGLGFDAIFAAVKFCKEELNLHSITFKFAAHNEQMANAFRYSQFRYETNKEMFEIKTGLPDVCYRREFVSEGNIDDYYGYTFILDSDIRLDDFLRLSSGKHNDFKDEYGELVI